MRPFVVTRSFAVALAVALLASCGGGDSGPSGTQPLTITADSPPAGTTGQSYPGYTFMATGGAPPLSWTTSGGLPAGLALSAAGQLSGTPAVANSYAISVTVSDSSTPPLTATAPVSLKINDSSIVIVSATLPAGTVTYPYPGFTFSANGGSPPYTWKASGTQPPGLIFGSDGTVSGTPTQLGTFTFSVTATDSAQPPTSSSPLAAQIMVGNPGTPPTINYVEPPTGTVGSAYAPFQFTANDGVPPLLWSEIGSLTTGLTFSSQGVLSGTPTSYGKYPITVDVTDALHRPAPSFATTLRVSMARPSVSFTPTGSLTIPRSGHAATLLLSGKVLVTGGANGKPDPTAELYDPASGTFSPTIGNMTEARSGHTATLLKLSYPAATNYGKVLIVGSVDSSAELYDPPTDTFAATGNMHHARTSPTATLLNTGKVLIVGGNTSPGDLIAELYDPASGTFSDTGSMTTWRSGHTATLLLDGHVLIAGGEADAVDLAHTAELYDPTAGTFTATKGNMTRYRSGHTAALLDAAPDSQYGQNGYVLILGTDGYADLYDPSTETFEGVGSLRSLFDSNPAGYVSPIFKRTMTLRNDGTVLSVGGYTPVFASCKGVPATGNSLNLVASFAPESDGFTETGSSASRDTHTATALQDGSVLATGGMHRLFNPGHCTPLWCSPCQVSTAVLSSAELFK
jgi:hypothetical protein